MSFRQNERTIIMETPEMQLGLNRDGQPELQTGKEHAATVQVRAWLLNAEGKVSDLTDLAWVETHQLTADWLNGSGRLWQHRQAFDYYCVVLDEWCLQRFAATLPTSADTPIYDGGEIKPTRISTFYTVDTDLPDVKYAVEVEIGVA